MVRGLRRLRVRVRGKDGLAVPVGEIDQGRAQLEHTRRQQRHELALPHPIHRHVDVVAAARGVQPAGDVLAAGVAEQPLDEEEQVLARAVVRDTADRVERDAVESVLQEHERRRG